MKDRKITITEISGAEFLNMLEAIHTELTELKKQIGNKNESAEALPTNAACKRYNISRQTLYNLRKRGILPSYELGSRVMFKVADIENAMQLAPHNKSK